MKWLRFFIRKKVELGSLVISSDNVYGRNIICVVDRLYKRDGVRYCRLLFDIMGASYKVNVRYESCKLDSSDSDHHLFI